MKKSIATIGVLAAANSDLFEMLRGVAASHNPPPGLYTPSPDNACFTQPFTKPTETPMGTFTGYLCSTPNCTEYVVPGTTGRLRRKSSFAFLPNARKENSYECNTCQQRKSLRGSKLQQRLRKDSQMLAAQLGVEWDSSQGHLTDAEVKQLFSQVGGGSDAQAEKAGWNGEVRSGTSLKKEYAASAKGGNFGGSLADDPLPVNVGSGVSAGEERAARGFVNPSNGVLDRHGLGTTPAINVGSGVSAEEERLARGPVDDSSELLSRKGLGETAAINVGSGASAEEERLARGPVEHSNKLLDRHGLGGSPAINVGSGVSRESEVAGRAAPTAGWRGRASWRGSE